jgi:hypothetical protein
MENRIDATNGECDTDGHRKRLNNRASRRSFRLGSDKDDGNAEYDEENGK